MSKGIFGSLFDVNRDGKMSSLERAAEFAFLHELMESEKKSANSSSTGFFSSGCSVTDDSDDRALDLMIAGLDENDLRWMDEDDRHAALEDAGLDPIDFDYLDF